MRPWIVALWSLTLASSGLCQLSAINEMFSLIPQCASSCILNAASASSCSLADVDCLCADTKFQKKGAECVLAGCGQAEMLNMLSGSSKVCNFSSRDQSQRLNIIIIAFTAVSSAVAVIRLAYQASPVGTGFYWDDWLMIPTLGLSIACGLVYTTQLIPYGLGTEVWHVEWDALIKFVNWFYIAEVLYFVAITLLKTSILFFFWRIFGQTNLANAIIGTIVVNAVYGIIFLFISVFQCSPIIFTWTELQYDRCMNVNAIIWSHAAISIAFDVWMLLLPMWRVRTLQMNWKRKIAVGLMLSTGIFVTIMSIIRLKSILVFTETINMTWEQSDVALWSTIELNVGVICACMPTLRHIIMSLLPRLRDTSKGHSSGYTGGSRSARSYVPASAVGASGEIAKQHSLHHHQSATDLTGDIPFKSELLPSNDPSVIVQTRDFVIDSDDEAQLVPMKTLDPKKKPYQIPKVYDLPT